MVEDALIRLANLRALGHGPADLVRLIGNSYPYWRDLLAGQKSFGEKAARNIEAKLGLHRGCLDTADGCKGWPPSTREPEPQYAVPRGLPVVGSAKLGDGGYFVELEHPVGHGDGRIDWPSRDPNAYALRCKGESMRPRIRNGEFVIVEPNHIIAPGDEVLVRARGGRVMVKEFAYEREGAIHLDSVNESHPKIRIPREEIEVMHYVAGIAKSALWHADDESQAPVSADMIHRKPDESSVTDSNIKAVSKGLAVVAAKKRVPLVFDEPPAKGGKHGISQSNKRSSNKRDA